MSHLYARVAVMALAMFGLALSATGAEETIFNRLKTVSKEVQLSPPLNDKDRQILKLVASLTAQKVIPPSPVPGFTPACSLNTTLRDYVAQIVFNAGASKALLTTLGFVPCTRDPSHRCAAIAGNPCAASTKGDCEGMTLVVVVDIDNKYSFDRAIGGGYYLLENVKDIEDLKAEAP